MEEEGWSGSSLGSSLLDEGTDDLPLNSRVDVNVDVDVVVDSMEEREEYNRNVEHEVKLLTAKYLSTSSETFSSLQKDNSDVSGQKVSTGGDEHGMTSDGFNYEDNVVGEAMLLNQEDFQHSDGNNGTHDMVELLLPSFVRLNKLLNENGCLTLSLNNEDIDENTRSLSVFVVDSWAESAVNFVAETLERREKSREEVLDASIEVQRSDFSISTLDFEVTRLKEKLEDAKAKEKELSMKLGRSDELAENLKRDLENVKNQSVRKIKQLEQMSEEKDRKLRKNELECEKMREKLLQLANKDRNASIKDAETLKNYKRGAEVVVASPLKLGKKSKSSPGGGNSVVSVDEVMQAMENEKEKLRMQNKEQEKQILALTKSLKKALNSQSTVSQDISLPKPPVPENVTESDDVNMLSNKVQEQSHRIRQLVHQLEAEKSTTKKLNEDMKVLRQRASEMREEIHNLRLEIDSRPTVAQWNSKLKEVAALESKLHDIVMMKGEAEELMNWRKHLSTSDRIKADRRNHELKLWLLESLPKSVMQDVLKSLCRELDVADVSEILPGVVKMKTVIRAVPRMEQFITTICNFVFQKDRPRHPEGDIISRPVMEDVLPVLKRWWSDLQNGKNYTKFQEDVMNELMRMDSLENKPPVRKSLIESPVNFERCIDMGGDMPAKWSGGPGSEISAIQKIKSLVDFQIELFRSSKSFVDAQTFISERPEVLVNSLIEHIRYLFGVKSLQGIIPRMNEVYLFSEEMCNFINNARKMMRMKNLPDATVLTEIYRRIESQEPKKPAKNEDDILSTSQSSVISKFFDENDKDYGVGSDSTSTDYLADD